MKHGLADDLRTTGALTGLIRGGYTIATDRLCERGFVYAIGSTLYAEPLTAFQMTHDGRLPLESRYSRGVLELERDRRRRR